MDPASKSPLAFLSKVETIWNELRDFANFEIAFVTFSSAAKDFVDSSCVSKGRYCVLPQFGGSQIKGRKVLLESLRQYCIFQLSVKEFFSYSKRFYREKELQFSKEFSMRLSDSLRMSSEVLETCFERSFDRDFPSQPDNDNKVLSSHRFRQEKFPPARGSFLSIGGQLIDSDLSVLKTLKFICRQLRKDSPSCKKFLTDFSNEFDLPSLLTMSLFVFTLFWFLLLMISRQVLRRKFIWLIYQGNEQVCGSLCLGGGFGEGSRRIPPLKVKSELISNDRFKQLVGVLRSMDNLLST